MELETGSRLNTSDGHDAGVISRLLVTADTHLVRTVVLRSGWLFTREVPVPRDAIRGDEEGGASVIYSADELGSFPGFDADSPVIDEPPLELTPPGRAGEGDPLEPAGGVAYTASGGVPLPPLPGWEGDLGAEGLSEVEEALSLAAADAVLAAGDPVERESGATAGTLRLLGFDLAEGHLTRLVVAVTAAADQVVAIEPSRIRRLATGLVVVEDEVELDLDPPGATSLAPA